MNECITGNIIFTGQMFIDCRLVVSFDLLLQVTTQSTKQKEVMFSNFTMSKGDADIIDQRSSTLSNHSGKVCTENSFQDLTTGE